MVRINSFFALSVTILLLVGCKQNKKSEKGQETTDTIENTEKVVPPKETKVNELSPEEKEEGWTLLFDGKSTDGWRGYNKDKFPENGWTVKDGTLMLKGGGAGEAGGAGDIIYDKKFKDFELSLEWKISKGGNSGILYLAREVEGQPIWKSAPEMQVLDNKRHPDAKLGKNGNRKAGSLYDLIPADPQNAKPVGQWNKVSVMVYRGTVVHKMNGENVVEYHLWTDDWKKMVKNSKFKGMEDFINAGGKDHKGYIGLQDHGDNVWYRNIKIKEL